MPDPVKAPPEELVNEMKTKVLLDVWNEFDEHPSKGLNELHKRDTKMINYLIGELAYLKAFLKHNNIEIK